MHRTPARALAVLALAAAALAAVACSPTPPTDTSVAAGVGATSSSGSTSTPGAEAAVSSGPITMPAVGTALRAKILEAAGAGLGLTGAPAVIQLYAQGGAAVGDIQPVDGSRMFFAVTGGPDAWSIAWSAPFGSEFAKLDALRSSAPLVSQELAGRLSWTRRVSTPVAKAPSIGSFKSFAAKSAERMAGPDYTGTFVVTAKIAKDSIGVWWGSALAQPSEEGLEPIGVWGRYSGGKWIGEIADFSSEDGAMGFFPADVVDKLAL
jgi:hypothetical protein